MTPSRARSALMAYRVPALVAAVSLVGLVSVITSARDLLRSGSPPRAVDVLLIAAIVLVGDISLLRIRFGANGNSFTWAEAAVIVGAIVGGWQLLIVIGTLTVLIRQLVVGRAVHKCLFNAGGFAVGVTLAFATYGAITGIWTERPQARLMPLPVLGLVAAAATYFLWISLVVVVAVGWSQGVPAAKVWAKAGRLRLLMFLGNTSAGLGAVLVGGWSRPTLLVLPFFLLAVYYVYNNYLRAQVERDRWRDLQAATLELQHVDPSAVTAAIQRGAETLFGADCTMLLLSDDPRSAGEAPAALATGLRAREPIIVKAADEPPRLRRELESLGVVEGVLAPIEGVSGRAGVLLMGFRGPAHLKPRELQVVATFANHASVSMQRARLFDEIDEQRSRLSAVIDNASDGVVLVGVDGVVASWNPGMTRLTSRPETSVVDQPFDEAFAARLPDGTRFAIEDVLEQFEARPAIDHLAYDVEVQLADGSTREAALSVSAVRGPSGGCEYAVVVARDITARREVQRAKQDLIATVSHELRTPLTPIKGFLSLFLRPGFQMDEEERKVIFAQMLDRANQLERLVEDLLSTSRIEHGEFSLRPEPTDVEAVAARAIEDLRIGTGRSVTYRVTGTPTKALCDPARLQQVIANLLSNADKYSPSAHPVNVEVSYGTDSVGIAVQDFGAGIPAEQQAEVFEPFRRLGDHLTRSTRGCGLGLHIARRLVESMDGQIWVKSSVGQGSTFHVSVPAAVPQEGTDDRNVPAWPAAALKAVG